VRLLPPLFHPQNNRPQLTAIKVKREAITSELDALREKQNDARGDVPALIAERKEASEVITALKKKQGEIRDAFNEKWQVRAGGLIGVDVIGGVIGRRCYFCMSTAD